MATKFKGAKICKFGVGNFKQFLNKKPSAITFENVLCNHRKKLANLMLGLTNTATDFFHDNIFLFHSDCDCALF